LKLNYTNKLIFYILQKLLAKAQKIKHAVPKGDKKRLKETKQEIAKLEMELDAKHQQELQEVFIYVKLSHV